MVDVSRRYAPEGLACFVTRLSRRSDRDAGFRWMTRGGAFAASAVVSPRAIVEAPGMQGW